jgi:hypothetical protein
VLACKRLEKKEKNLTRVFWNGKTKRCCQENSKVLEKALTHRSSKTVWCVPSHNLITDETAFKPACYRLAHTHRAQIGAYQRSLDSTFSRTCDCIKGDNSTTMTAFLLRSLLLTTHEYSLSLPLSLSLSHHNRNVWQTIYLLGCIINVRTSHISDVTAKSTLDLKHVLPTELQRKPNAQKEADSKRGRKKPNEDKRMECERVQTQSQGLWGSFFFAWELESCPLQNKIHNCFVEFLFFKNYP